MLNKMRPHWFKEFTWLGTANQSALFQNSMPSYTTLKFVFDIGSLPCFLFNSTYAVWDEVRVLRLAWSSSSNFNKMSLKPKAYIIVLLGTRHGQVVMGGDFLFKGLWSPIPAPNTGWTFFTLICRNVCLKKTEKRLSRDVLFKLKLIFIFCWNKLPMNEYYIRQMAISPINIQPHSQYHKWMFWVE